MPCTQCVSLTAAAGVLTRCPEHPLRDKGLYWWQREKDTITPSPRTVDTEWGARPLKDVVPVRTHGLVPDPVVTNPDLNLPPIRRTGKRKYRTQGSVLRYPNGLKYEMGADYRPFANRGVIKDAER